MEDTDDDGGSPGGLAELMDEIEYLEREMARLDELTSNRVKKCRIDEGHIVWTWIWILLAYYGKKHSHPMWLVTVALSSKLIDYGLQMVIKSGAASLLGTIQADKVVS